MLIRFFRDLDYAPVSQLLNAVYRNPTRMAHLTPERLRTEYRNRGTNPHENCVVLESPEGELVGFCGYEPLPDGRALLDGPVLRNEFRGQGWGRRLWQEVADLLRARGIRTGIRAGNLEARVRNRPGRPGSRQGNCTWQRNQFRPLSGRA